MGSPKFTHRKYTTPSHPWESARIQSENELKKQYGLKNKREIWKANSKLRGMRHNARRIIAQSASGAEQVELEKQQQLTARTRMGMLDSGSNIGDILTLELGNLLSRRLQTLVYHRGLASTMKQARQFIVHGHITMGGRVVRTPSQLVPKGLEETITINEYSPLIDEEHPMRVKATPGEERTEAREPPARRERPPRKEEKAEKADKPKAEEPKPEKAKAEEKAPAEEKPKADDKPKAEEKPKSEPKAAQVKESENKAEPAAEPAPKPAAETKEA